MEKRQGKCDYCKVAYRWEARREYPLKRAYCGRCGGKLKATTHLLKAYRWVEANANANICGNVIISARRTAPESAEEGRSDAPANDRTSDNGGPQRAGEELR